MPQGELNTEILLQNNARSQELLYKHYAPKMYGICMRFTGNQMEADDILQDGFIKIFTKLKDFRNEGSLEGWIRKTIINTAINFYRKKLKYSYFDDIEGLEVPETKEENIYDKLSKEELIKLIQELPNGYRTIFNLYVIEGYSHKEIGKMLNISNNTSKSQLTRARNILQRKVLALMKEKVKVPFENFRVIRNEKIRYLPEFLKAV
ncbi:MAG: sigma-70 family RNA polymerase sigma factor [Bacteroidetes bacterium]|nr:sigma-70 family RNA polymerase sigma factor [Bacteroidota bacterium]MBL7105025.1 sigma-70 family RNA polymerase sigma factor [Bacteroidales bacterium]